MRSGLGRDSSDLSDGLLCKSLIKSVRLKLKAYVAPRVLSNAKHRTAHKSCKARSLLQQGAVGQTRFARTRRFWLLHVAPLLCISVSYGHV